MTARSSTPLLHEVADAGVWVSAHPEVISKMGTKEVLVETAHMSWGSETRLYRSAAELREQLPGRLGARGPLVLKQHRGMGGNGVWKVELDDADEESSHSTRRKQATLERCHSTSSSNAASRTSRKPA